MSSCKLSGSNLSAIDLSLTVHFLTKASTKLKKPTTQKCSLIPLGQVSSWPLQLTISKHQRCMWWEIVLIRYTVTQPHLLSHWLALPSPVASSF